MGGEGKRLVGCCGGEYGLEDPAREDGFGNGRGALIELRRVLAVLVDCAGGANGVERGGGRGRAVDVEEEGPGKGES